MSEEICAKLLTVPIESLLQYTKIQHTQYHLYDKHYYCFQNFHLILFTIFFILSLASHLQQNKQCLSAYVGSNLAVPMVSGLSDAMCTAFLFGTLCCILPEQIL